MVEIKNAIVDKACLKQDVYALTKSCFHELGEVLSSSVKELQAFVHPKDKRVNIEFKKISEFEFQLTIGGDTLIFYMHTNVFTFPNTHIIHKNTYVQKDRSRAYCGVINVYNFLTDSFKYNRMNDSGYLVARVFVNKDKHYFVEGKQKLGFLFNDFANAELVKSEWEKIMAVGVDYILNFDLFTPPYQTVKEISINDIQQLNQSMKMKTAKRLGFKFQSDQDVTF